jgi:hypothetical protein
MLLYAQGLFPANQSEPRAAKFLRYFVPTKPLASVKIANALPYAQASLFCLISSEAYLLRGRKKDILGN